MLFRITPQRCWARRGETHYTPSRDVQYAGTLDRCTSSKVASTPRERFDIFVASDHPLSGGRTLYTAVYYLLYSSYVVKQVTPRVYCCVYRAHGWCRCVPLVRAADIDSSRLASPRPAECAASWLPGMSQRELVWRCNATQRNPKITCL